MPTDPMPGTTTVLYDADCGFCQACVDWVARRLPPHAVRFLPRDSPEATSLAAAWGAPTTDSVMMASRGEVLVRSDAVLSLLAQTRFPWHLARLARVVPRPLRDAVYDTIARRRRPRCGSENRDR